MTIIPLKSQEKNECTIDCFKNIANKFSKFRNNSTYFLLSSNENLFSNNEFLSNQKFDSYLIKKFIDTIYFLYVLDENNLSIFSDLKQILIKNGIRFNTNKIINPDKLLTNSLNIYNSPFKSNTDINENIILNFFDSDIILLNNFNNKDILLHKIINGLNPNYYSNYLNNLFNITLNFNQNKKVSLNENQIESIFFNITKNADLKNITNKYFFSKNYSVNKNFPGNAYIFYELPYIKKKAFILIHSDESVGELILSIPELEYIFYVYSPRTGKLELLKMIDIIIQTLELEDSVDFNLYTENFSDFSGEYIPADIPDKSLYYFINIFNSISIKEEIDHITLNFRNWIPLSFFSIDNIQFKGITIPESSILFYTDDNGTTIGFHLSLGENRSYKKIPISEKKNFIFFILISFIYFTAIPILLYISYYKYKNILYNFSLEYNFLKINIFISSISISFYILLFVNLCINYYLKYSNNLSEIYVYYKILIYFIFFVNIIIFFQIIKLFLNNILNYWRIIKYSIYVIMVVLFFFFILLFNLL